MIECRQRVEEIERSMEMVHDKSKTQAILGIILIVLGVLALCAIIDDLWYCVKLRYKTRSKSRRAENRGMNNHAH